MVFSVPVLTDGPVWLWIHKWSFDPLIWVWMFFMTPAPPPPLKKKIKIKKKKKIAQPPQLVNNDRLVIISIDSQLIN